jgi:hypothetical protein
MLMRRKVVLGAQVVLVAVDVHEVGLGVVL